ncbi:peptidase inhibitor family I36 protein [Micromonospora sp. NPDC007208]|uniref:peptidase inhibitor family I36 protein n=1 Tax=Micromonospora sp. NPDC007208 TaxID=3364236 RepID=UPI003676C212
MKPRLFLIAALAAVVATLTVPSAAHATPDDSNRASVAGISAQALRAGPDDNNNASVSGISSQAAGSCPYTALCLYTEGDFRGRMFVIYACGNYALFNWNGWGSVYNNQTPSYWAYLLDQNGNEAHGFVDGAGASWVEFDPYWYAKPC